MRRLLLHITLLLALVAITGTASAGQKDSPGLSPPLNTSAPAISGNPIRGLTLTASTGAWDGPNAQYSFQWNRCDAAGNACTALAGAVSSTFQTGDADVTRTLRVSVTATNKNGSTSATSNATSPVTAPSPAPSTSTSNLNFTNVPDYYGDHDDDSDDHTHIVFLHYDDDHPDVDPNRRLSRRFV